MRSTTSLLLLLMGGLWLPLAAQPPKPEKPAMNVYPSDEADRPKFPRAYPGAPPVMTHGARDLSVTLKDNDCLQCHTPPDSHSFNPYRDTKPGDKLVRYNCLQCHVPQALEKDP